MSFNSKSKEFFEEKPKSNTADGLDFIEFDCNQYSNYSTCFPDADISSQCSQKFSSTQKPSKERFTDRYIPFRGFEDTHNFYDLSCSLAEYEDTSRSQSQQSGAENYFQSQREREDSKRAAESYSSMLVKGMFNYNLDFQNPSKVTHYYEDPPETNLSTQVDKESYCLLSGSSTGVGSGLSFSGAFTKPNGLTNSSSSNLVLSRGFEPNGLGKILKYRNSQETTSNSFSSSISVLSQKIADKKLKEDTIDFEEDLFGVSNPIKEENFASQERPSINSLPYKILEAPGIREDFYYNLIDWSKKNILAVSLQEKAYLWNADSFEITCLSELFHGKHYTSVQWDPSGTFLALGTNTGILEIWDTHKGIKLNEFHPHSNRIGNIQWSSNVRLVSGSRDRTIVNCDMRVSQMISRMRGHKQEVCGLRFSPECDLLASGGNDYKIYIWSLHKDKPLCRLNYHRSAVKALDWNPRQRGVLVSGGGNNDKTIKVYNSLTEKLMREVSVGNQVCNIWFSEAHNEFITTHGFTENNIAVWNYENLEQIANLEGHLKRVLYMCMSPDGESMATAAGDEIIKFWKVFQSPKKPINRKISPTSIHLR